MQRRRHKKQSNFLGEYGLHLSMTSAHIKANLSRSFILVAQDVDSFPAPDSIIAVTSPSRPRYWYASRDDYNDDMLDMSYGMKKERQFNHELSTYEKGTKDLRYFMVVDHINDDGEVVCYDDFDGMHVFSDRDVQVVDLYLYPASSWESTFKVGYDFKETALAIPAEVAFNDKEGVICVIHDNTQLMFERCLLTLGKDVMSRISKEYSERGMVIDNKVPIIRVRLESCVLYGKELDSGLTPYVVEALEHLRDKGYHIDLVSDEYKSYHGNFDEVKDSLKQLGIKYDTFNSMYRFDFIVDTRNAMNYGNINWTEVYYNITKESLMERIMNETDENAPLLGDLDNVSDDLPQFSGEYSDLLEITKDTFDELVENNVLTEVYPLAPISWETIRILQETFKSNIPYDSISEKYKELIGVLGLKEFFE